MTMNMVMTTVKMMMVVVKDDGGGLDDDDDGDDQDGCAGEQRQETWRLVMRMAMLIMRMKMVGVGIIRMTRMGMMRD